MFVPLRPTQQDRNSFRLHDSIIKCYNFTQTCGSKLQQRDRSAAHEHTIKSEPKRSV